MLCLIVPSISHTGNAPAPSSRRSRWDRAAEDTGPQPQPGEVREENTYSYLKQDQQITGNDGQYSASDRVNYSDSTGYTDQWRTESHHDLSSRSNTFTDHERDMSSGGQLAEDPVTGQSGRAQNYSGGGFGVRTDPERQSSWMREDIDGQPLGRRYSDDEAQKRKFIEAFGSTYAQKSDSDDSDSSPSESSPEPSPKKAAGFTMTMDRSSKPAAAPQSMKATGFSMTMNKAPSLSQKTTVTLSSGSISKKPVAPIKMSLGAQVGEGNYTRKDHVLKYYVCGNIVSISFFIKSVCIDLDAPGFSFTRVFAM